MQDPRVKRNGPKTPFSAQRRSDFARVTASPSSTVAYVRPFSMLPSCQIRHASSSSNTQGRGCKAGVCSDPATGKRSVKQERVLQLCRLSVIISSKWLIEEAWTFLWRLPPKRATEPRDPSLPAPAVQWGQPSHFFFVRNGTGPSEMGDGEWGTEIDLAGPIAAMTTNYFDHEYIGDIRKLSRTGAPAVRPPKAFFFLPERLSGNAGIWQSDSIPVASGGKMLFYP